MTLMQISNPRNKKPSPDIKTGIAVGIDFGTTNSVVCFTDSNKKPISCFETYLNEEKEIKSDLIPSVVAIHRNGTVIVGGAAALLNNNEDYVVIKSVKRLIAAHMSKIPLDSINKELKFSLSSNHVPEVIIFGKKYNLLELSAYIISYLKKIVENQLQKAVDQCVITVPAYFDDYARNLIKKAAEISGFQVLRVINEPTAAALAYGIDNDTQGIYCVYDLGGGTFDISVLRMEQGVFQVLSTVGDTMLGGDDIDDLLVQKARDHLQQNQATATVDLNKKVIEMKHKLSNSEKVTLEVGYDMEKKPVNFSYAKKEYETVITPLIEKTLSLMDEALESSEITEPLQGIIMVGGSTRIPLISSLLKKKYNTKIWSNLDPDRIVAFGAANKASGLNYNNSNITLVDVIPLSLGIETMGGNIEKIIHRNTAIPIAIGQEFTTFKNNQTGFDIHIVQGERETVAHCRSLGRFKITGLQPGIAGSIKLKVIFRVDTDGILTVTANEIRENGASYSIEVNPTYNLTSEEVKEMVQESVKYAKEDITQRLAHEGRIEAEKMVSEIETAMADLHILPTNEAKEIEDGLILLRTALTTDDKDKINEAKNDLRPIIENFAQKRIAYHLNHYVKKEEENE